MLLVDYLPHMVMSGAFYNLCNGSFRCLAISRLDLSARFLSLDLIPQPLQHFFPLA